MLPRRGARGEGNARRTVTRYSIELMNPITIKFGGYQKPASIHNRAAAHFGATLTARLGDRVRFELIGSVLDQGRKSGDLPLMVESGELALCYISTVRFTAMICNDALYRSWPSDVQLAVEDAARRATAHQWQLAGAEDAEILAKLDPRENEVIRLTDAERAQFVAAVRPVREKYRKELDPKLFAYLGA